MRIVRFDRPDSGTFAKIMNYVHLNSMDRRLYMWWEFNRYKDQIDKIYCAWNKSS